MSGTKKEGFSPSTYGIRFPRRPPAFCANQLASCSVFQVKT